MGNIGKGLKSMVASFTTGRNIEEAEKRTEIARLRQKADEAHQAKGRALAERQMKLDEAVAITEKRKILVQMFPYMQKKNMSPDEAEKLASGIEKQFGFDMRPMMFQEKDDKGFVTGVSFQSEDMIAKQMETEQKVLDRAIEKQKADTEAYKAETERMKFEKGQLPKQWAHAAIESIYKSDEWKKLEEKGDIMGQIDLLAEKQRLFATANTQTEGPVSKKLSGELEGEMKGMLLQVHDLERISENFSESFFILTGKLNMAYLRGRAKLSETTLKGLSQDEINTIEAYGNMRKANLRVIARYTNEISGAQFSMKELKMYSEALFNADDDPITYRAAFNDYVGFIKRSYRMKSILAAQGFSSKKISAHIEGLNKIKALSDERNDPTLSVKNRNIRAVALMKQLGEEYSRKGMEIDDEVIKFEAARRMRAEGFYNVREK